MLHKISRYAILATDTTLISIQEGMTFANFGKQSRPSFMEELCPQQGEIVGWNALPKKEGIFMNKGCVYILTNPSLKENWIKIGFTNNIKTRVATLSSGTGVPLPFEMYAMLKTAKYQQAEKMIHKMIKIFSPEKRINPKKEFFNLEPEEAATIFKMVADILDDSEFEYCESIVASKAQAKIQKVGGKKSPKKTFYDMGLQDGDEIKFISNPTHRAIICGERVVMFQGKQWFLTPLTYHLYEQSGEKCTHGSGFSAFQFNDDDRDLYARWERIVNKRLI